ncbi:hypothetical protein Taro_007075, partial [Colocasia esculenta]|nr:hypothetical protein [Colocasia esculenta]
MRKKLGTRFPASRIKKIMQADEDVGKIAMAVPLPMSLIPRRSSSTSRFFRKTLSILAGLYFLVSIGLLTSNVSIYYYLKIIKLLMTGQNQEITPHVRNYRKSPLRSNNSIELSMT